MSNGSSNVGKCHFAWRDSRQEWWIGVCNNPACGFPMLILNDGAMIFPYPGPDPTDPSIPADIRRDLDEAKKCLAHDCPRAAAVLARRCIQTACIALEADPAKALIKQIDQLLANGVITKDIQEWLHVGRWIGNDAAHPGGDDVTKEDAEIAVEMAEEFLHVTFVTPAIAREARAKMGK
jgi:hypothetical protein